MSPIAPGAGIDLEYEEIGDGATVVLVHGIAGAAGDPGKRLAAEIGGRARVISYARRGYGGSGCPEPYVSTTAAEQGEDLGALVAALDAGGATAVGEGFGALVVLDRLIRAPGEIGGAVLSDPPLLAFVPDGAEQLAAERELIEAAVATGGPQAAVDIWVDPADPASEEARADFRGALADWSATASLPVRRAELESISVPVTVVTGPSTPPHVVAAADALAAAIPGCGRRTDGDVALALEPLVA